MLITELKERSLLDTLVRDRVFLLICHGCKETRFPEEEVRSFCKELESAGKVTGTCTTEYICDPENLKRTLEGAAAAIDGAQGILVFSCGVGVQTVADLYPAKYVAACCDTYALPGFQGVTPLEHDCDRCGQCYLNLTGGICPLTACSKGLLNGQCGGAKNGMCEVDSTMPCGWERIMKKLAQVGRLDALKCPVQLRNYAVDPEV